MTLWKTLHSTILEKNQWLTLRKDSCTTPKGKSVDDYYVLEIPDIVSIIAVTKEKNIVLIREYKHGVQSEILQIPSGYMNKGEAVKQSAQRELREETGYEAEEWFFLGKKAGSPGRVNHFYHFFLALHAEKTAEQKTDELEEIAVSLFSFEDAKKQIEMHQSDLMTATGITLAERFLMKEDSLHLLRSRE